jgi:small subunit ribosomal protein S6
MPFYENVFIARQDVSSQQVEALAQQFGEIVKANGGTVVKVEHWGLKTLAFRVKKNRKGHYVLLGLDAPPAAIRELERNQIINEDVIRQLTVRVDAVSNEPSAMLARSRRESERRGHENGEPPGDDA